MRYRTTAVLGMALVLATSAAWAGQGAPVVQGRGYLSVSALRPGSAFKLAVVLDIRKGFHIGAAVPKADRPARLELHSSPDVTLGRPSYPPGTMKSFAFSAGDRIPVYEGRIRAIAEGRVAGNAKPGERGIEAVLFYQPCSENQCLPPSHVAISVPTKIALPGARVTDVNQELFRAAASPKAAPAELGGDAGRVAAALGRGGILGFLALFGLGLLLSLSPCVYPMIPVTIGYFGVQTERRTRGLAALAGLYVLGMALTYSVLGALAALSRRVFGAALQNPYVLLGVAVVLAALALSMFGLYEFRVPGSLAARATGRRGAIGAFLMGLLFGIVAAPCVGPVVIGLLVLVARSGSPVFGFFAFFFLAVGIGTPFFFLATFSGALNRLPKAGAWMLSIRRVCGLLLLGAAVYYLLPLVRAHIPARLADLALPIFVTASGIYLGWFERGLRKLPKLRAVRSAVGLAAIAFGASFTLVPAHRDTALLFAPYTDRAVARAAAAGKPVMIDFTADWCPACKELDDRTFPDREVEAEAKRFVRLRADQTQAASPDVNAREERYSILGLPTIVFLDSSGHEVESARVVGFVPPDRLLKVMRTVR